ncbi:MAG: hypothetical protein ABIF82_14190 [Planctomycetota bacterium]
MTARPTGCGFAGIQWSHAMLKSGFAADGCRALRATLLTLLTVAAATAAFTCVPPPVEQIEPFARDAEPADQEARQEAPAPQPPLPPARFAAAKATDPIEAVIVRADDSALVPIVIPLIKRLAEAPRAPAFVAIGSPPTEEAVDLLRRLSPRRSVVITAEEDPNLARGLEEIRADVLITGADAPPAAEQIAKRFWDASREVVAAPANKPATLLMASLLASHLGAPLLPVNDNADAPAAVLDELRAERVLLVLPDNARHPAWTKRLKQKVQVLDADAVNQHLVKELGAANIRNLILVRAPNEDGVSGACTWLAPHLSVARAAPVVLCSDADGAKAEATAAAFVRRHGLTPRSVTILASYEAIGTVLFKDAAKLGTYEVDIEPCSGPGKGGAATYGVGRIPGRSLCESSLLIARVLARDRLIAKKRFRALMIANPSTEYGPLPLCETVSRITAEEFKNCRVLITESYGKPADDPATLEAARQAHLIIFEGHITDQLLFTDPVIIPDAEPEPQPEPGPVFIDHGLAVMRIFAPEGELIAAQPDPAPAETAPDSENTKPDQDEPDDDVYAPDPHDAEPQADQERPAAGEAAPAPLPEGPAAVPEPPKQQPPLDGMPLVILQSCHSLEENTARVVFRRGGSGLIGSVTNIHSASGSSLIKAFCDGVLYRGETAGEALKNARNYFMCLAELKAKRGHKEQDKVYRVAMSFRLWGDPEMQVIHRDPAKPKLKPVSFTWAEPDRLVVAVPRHRLPNVKTDKYEARMFPNSGAAGIVKRLKKQPQRRLMPIYFSTLTPPEGFVKAGFSAVNRAEDKNPRSVFLLDDHCRSLCILYFPETEKARAAFTLQFRK